MGVLGTMTTTEVPPDTIDRKAEAAIVEEKEWKEREEEKMVCSLHFYHSLITNHHPAECTPRSTGLHQMPHRSHRSEHDD